ncbi:MAG: hypothetical protein M1818_003343 [Claussenomyces sp. TS43310]|nr:MAG: hypothetical protein M1818_003343 [Claussenomyces sp. TS43310]
MAPEDQVVREGRGVEKEEEAPSSDSSMLETEKPQNASMYTRIEPPSYLRRTTTGGRTLGEEQERRITHLARQFSGYSETSRVSRIPSLMGHPFEVEKDSSLDPTSQEFDAELWVKAFLHVLSRDPERYPQRTAGVAYQNLNVYGYGSDTDFQKDVGNVFLHGFNLVKDLVATQQREIQILKNLDGLIRTGEMCVVLGRPGSWTDPWAPRGQRFSLQLPRQVKDSAIVRAGVNQRMAGISREMMQNDFRGEVVYQAETDIHFPHLTVGQTLTFASLARTPRTRMPGVSRQQYADHLRDVVMALFGLSHTTNTKVGNDFVRGVSGGERKRVSIAEVTLSQSPLQCWDNSTRGLDSATALQFIKTLRLATSLSGSTAIVAIYQASQDAYDNFDKVAVLYEGQQIYFGHKDDAKKYFTDMGYICLERQTTADFLTSLTNPAERIVAPGFEDRVPRTPNEFAAVWEHSDARHELLREIHQFNEDFPISGPHLDQFIASRKAQQASWMSVKSPYTISIPMQVRLCMTRGFQRLRGELTFPLITVTGNLVISLVLGSVFYDLDETTESFFGRDALLFFAILFNALSNALEILPLYVSRPVVEKHATYALYHPFSESISSMICDLPTKVFSTLFFNIPLYFMANLRQEVGSVFIFLLFGFVCTLTMSMMFRTIGQASRTISQAMAPLALFIIALVIYAGFVLPVRTMQGWLRWINYLNPVGYAFESLMGNEFHNRNFPCAGFIPAGPTYENATGLEKTCSTAGAAPGAAFVNGDVYIEANFGYYHSHLWRNLGILFGFMFFFAGVYLFIAEKLSFSKSKGEVLLFRRGYGRAASKRARDEESRADVDIETNLASEDRVNKTDEQVQIHRQTAIFHWEDVCYDITIKGNPRRILDQVDGWVKPGTLTALMGASGAGKTTLLDVLASRVTMGVVGGDMMVNGHARDDSFQRKTGYVQQQDLHLLTSTVREALRFSALLRQPHATPKEEKLAYVEEVIKLLEMEKYANAVVGVPGEGLNVEQRKRLTIGVELAAKPDLLLFLDEPTSGLDSQTAWSICTLIKKLTDNGQAILCTIHQPSAVLFQRFDRLLLLAKGGRTVYFGDIGQNAKTMSGYFEKYGARPIKEAENPAEWMLEVIGAAPGVHVEEDWAQIWRDSPNYVTVKDHLKQLRQELSDVDTPKEDSLSNQQFSAPFYFQLYMCLVRAFEQYWRTPSYIYSKLLLCFLAALFIGLSFLNEPVSIQGLQNQMFSVFMMMIIFAFLVYQTMPNFITQRDLYEVRERPSKTYSWKAFMTANILVELPWATVAALLLFFPFYYLVGMYHNAIPAHEVHIRGFLMFLLMWSFMIFASTFTSMVVAGVATAEIGAIIALLLFAMCLIFCGVLATPVALPGFWIFMYRVNPFTYLIGALLSTGLANNNVTCDPIELVTFMPPSGQTCGQYMAPYMQLAGGAVYNPDATANCEFCTIAETNVYLASIYSFYSQRWRNFGFMWIYICFNTAAAVFFYWLARVPKKSRSRGV